MLFVFWNWSWMFSKLRWEEVLRSLRMRSWWGGRSSFSSWSARRRGMSTRLDRRLVIRRLITNLEQIKFCYYPGL